MPGGIKAVGGTRFVPRDGKVTTLDPDTSQRDGRAELPAKQAYDALGWYKGMTADIFG